MHNNLEIYSMQELTEKYYKSLKNEALKLAKKKQEYINAKIKVINYDLNVTSEFGRSYIEIGIEEWAYPAVVEPFISKGYVVKILYRYKDTDGTRYIVPDQNKNYCTCYKCRIYIIPPKENFLQTLIERTKYLCK